MSADGEVDADRVWKRFRADRSAPNIRTKVSNLGATMPGRRRYTWALRDISLHAEPGDSVGLIGRNGSGKSTLLKMLGRVMYPYAGSVRATGRIGALIEVRAGIHPELTGRENVELYGTLLGLTRGDVRARFDEIIDFAEVADAVDRQVKFYSSGMQMRLGFAVAAFLEPDVLLVDEVLAVGDASFQHKCLDRMRAVLDAGTTLVFVSHDLPAVQAVCERTVWLDQGLLRAEGPSEQIIASYRASVEAQAESGVTTDGPVRLASVELDGGDGPTGHSGEPLTVALTIDSDVRRKVNIAVGITDGTANPILLVRSVAELAGGRTTVRCTIGPLPLAAGRYFVWTAVVELPRKRQLVPWQPSAGLNVVGPRLAATLRGVVRTAPVWVPADWEVEPGAAAAATDTASPAGATQLS